VNILTRAQNAGLKLITGAFRTTPGTAMHHIAAILPIPHLLKKLVTNAAVRLRTLPSNSQLLSRLPATWDPPPASPSLPALKSGASYTIFHEGSEVARGQFGLGRKAGVYDGEMFALAAASVRIRALLTEQGSPLRDAQISRVHIFADNTSAISTI
ncbi:hypothetical protein BV25DRAFT_1777054, partial [Artomyces pyxidatus]